MTAATAKTEQPIRFAGSALGAERHICAFFNSSGEKYRVLLPFIKEGLEPGERAFHIVDPAEREAHLRQLGSAGIDAASVEKIGQFELLDWNEFYFPDGRFNEERTVAQWIEALEGAVQKGYPRTRVIARLEWARDDADELLQYESNFNRTPRNRDPVICIYDLSKHSATFIMDIMRTHPMIIIGGILQVNPFYVPPDQFLQELRGRTRSFEGSPLAAN
ncbi:MAG: MEDS domain-containing protein [Burkholderiales bacterium]